MELSGQLQERQTLAGSLSALRALSGQTRAVVSVSNRIDEGLSTMSCLNTTEEKNLISIVAGEDLTIDVTVVDPESTADDPRVDLTDALVYMTVRKRSTETTTYLRKRNTAAGGSDAEALVLLPQENDDLGRFQIYLVPSDTAILKPESYVYDIWVQLAAGKRYAVVRKSTFRVEPRVSILP